MINKKNMMNQLKKVQDMQQELENTEFVGSAGGGLVTVKINGKKEVLNLLIDKEQLEDDFDLLEEALIAALNDAFKKVDKKQEEMFGPMMGGLGLF